MDRELYFLPEHGCYVVRWTARITKDTSIEHWRDLVERPEFTPELAALHDFRAADVHPDRKGTIEVGHVYRREIEPRVGFGRVAIMVATGEAFAAAERLINLLELDGTLISYDESDAKAWIGLPRDFDLPYTSPA